MLMGALGQWVENYSKRFSTLEFFVIGGGLVLADIDDSAELNRIVAENPFTPFMDVEIMPVVEPGTAMATYGEIVAAFAGSSAAFKLTPANRSHAVRCVCRSAAARPGRGGPGRAGLVLVRCAQGGLPGRPGAGGHHPGSGLDPARGRAGMWPWSTWRPMTWPPRSPSWAPRRSRSTAGSAAKPARSMASPWDDGFIAPELVLDYGTSRI